MYIEIGTDNNNMVVYDSDSIKSISFMPERDQTMQTLPIEELDVVIEDETHSESWFVNNHIRVNSGQPVQPIVYSFRIYDARALSHGLYQIKAASNVLKDLDSIVLPANFYNYSVYWSNIIGSIFSSVYPDEPQANLPYTISQSAYNVFQNLPVKYFGGFAPEQTARERLRQICQALGLVASISEYNGKVYIEAAQDNQYYSSYSDHLTLRGVDIANTCKGVRKIKKEVPSAIKYTAYSNWSTTAVEGYERIQIGKTDDFPDPQPVYAWVQTTEHTIESSGKGSPITIEKNYFIVESNYHVIEYMSAAYFRQIEYELDYVDLPVRRSSDTYMLGRIAPGVSCAVNILDDHQQYRGIVRKSEFHFGTTVRQRLTIALDNEPVCQMVKCTFYGVYKNGTDERLLWKLDYWLSPDHMMYGYDKRINNPVVETYVEGRLERFVPQNPTSYISLYSGSTEEYRTATAYYTRVDDPD